MTTQMLFGLRECREAHASTRSRVIKTCQHKCSYKLQQGQQRNAAAELQSQKLFSPESADTTGASAAHILPSNLALPASASDRSSDHHPRFGLALRDG